MLKPFHKTVLIVACIILFFSFIIIAINMYNKNSMYIYPPVVPSCPDYWYDESNNINGSRCVNKNKIGICDNDVMDFTTSKWIGKRGLCNKKIWAKNCNIYWEGISNNNLCNI